MADQSARDELAEIATMRLKLEELEFAARDLRQELAAAEARLAAKSGPVDPAEARIDDLPATATETETETETETAVAPGQAPEPEETPQPARPRTWISDLELGIGAVWLRVGLAVMVVSFGLLAKLVHPLLQPPSKVLLSYLAAAALSGVGWLFRNRLSQFARPVIAGGIALAFFTSFAAHFLQPMACIPLWASLLLMAMTILALLGCAEGWGSEATAGLGIFLGYVAVYVASDQASTFSLVAILFLIAAALVFFWRHDSLPLNLFSVLAAFLSHILWALRAGPAASVHLSFWYNLPFLVAYYLSFVFSDLLFQHFIRSRGSKTFTRGQLIAGRAVGPSSLILFVTITAWIFATTEVYWDRIHFFLLPLAALQGVLLVYHRRRKNPDHALYAMAAAIFMGLGLFSLLDGLTLNLALAAEALLLMMLARTLSSWYMMPLAQIVLGISYVHYWLSQSHIVDTWPAFIGTVATAAVYFVKSRLMETWRPNPADPDKKPARGTVIFRQFMHRYAIVLAYIQILGGCSLLIYLCHNFFKSSEDALALALLALPVMAAALVLKSLPMVLAALVLQYGSLYIVRFADPEPELATWLLVQGTVVVIVLGGGMGLVLARIRQRSFGTLAAGGLAFATVGTFVCSYQGEPRWIPIWLPVPLLLWLASELCFDSSDKDTSDAETDEPDTGVVAPRTPVDGAGLEFVLPIAAAALTAWVATQVLDFSRPGLWFLSALTWPLLAITLWRRSHHLARGLATHLLISTLILLGAGYWADELLVLSIIAGQVVTAGILLAGFRLRRGFAGAGMLAMVLALISLGWLCAAGRITLSRTELWLLIVAGLWFTIDRLQANRSQRLAPVAALALASLQTAMIHQSWELASSRILAMTLLALALVAAAIGRSLGRGPRSSPRSGAASEAGTGSFLLLGFVVHLGLTVVSLVAQAPRLPEEHWVGWAVVAECVLLGLVLLVLARVFRRASMAAAGAVCMVLLVAAYLGLILGGSHRFTPFPLWLAILAGAWLGVELLRRAIYRDPEAAAWTDRSGLAFLRRNTEKLAIGWAVSFSAVVFGLAQRHFSSGQETAWFLAVVTVPLLIAAVGGSPALGAGLLAHLIIANVVVRYADGVIAEPFLALILLSETVAAAAVLLYFAARVRRGSLAYAGVACTSLVLVAAAGLMIPPAAELTPFLLWVVAVAGLWLAIEQIRVSVTCLIADAVDTDGKPLTDRIALHRLPGNPKMLSIMFSAVAALLLTAMIWTHFSDPFTPTAGLMVFTLISVVASAILRSPSLGAAGAVLLAASHCLFYLDIGLRPALTGYGILGLVLAALTLILGAVLEATAGQRLAAGWGWLVYLAGLVLGHLILIWLGDLVFGSYTAGLPLQMILASLTMLAAFGFGLPRLHRVALLSTIWVFASLVSAGLSQPMHLLGAGFGVCLQAILVERICAAQRCQLPARLRRVASQLLIVTIGSTMLLVFWLASNVQGYWKTAGWGLVAMSLVGLGFIWKDRTYRWTGLVIIALVLFRVAFIDLQEADQAYQVLGLMCLSLCLLLVGYLYARFREQLSRWL